MPNVQIGGQNITLPYTPEELLQKILDALTGGDKELVEAFKNRGGAGGAGGLAGGGTVAVASDPGVFTNTYGGDSKRRLGMTPAKKKKKKKGKKKIGSKGKKKKKGFFSKVFGSK